MVSKVSPIELIFEDGARMTADPVANPEASIVVGRSSESGIRLLGDSISRHTPRFDPMLQDAGLFSTSEAGAERP